MKILVLNAGSSSIKYSLFAMETHQVLIAGLIERLGEHDTRHCYQLHGAPQQTQASPSKNHQQAIQELFSVLTNTGALADFSQLACIGHRVVHGGDHFQQPTLINAQVIQQIPATIPLAPLHNPANLLGIQEAMQHMADIPQVAVFDTAFHQTLPDYAYRYALPQELYTQHAVRRYGFHGTSHCYVAGKAAEGLGKALAEINLITLHLGNGASVSAIQNGRSIDTSMGMTPLEGLMMGTRCGDIDPAIIFYLSNTLSMPMQTIENLLNKASGCKGVCGENDMRTLQQLADSGEPTAILALEMYAYRIKKYIGAYFAVLNKVDAIVFTGGIGENDSWLREKCCANLEGFGIAIDHVKNSNPTSPYANINTTDARIAVLVIPTDEELEIAMQAQACLSAHT